MSEEIFDTVHIDSFEPEIGSSSRILDSAFGDVIDHETMLVDAPIPRLADPVQLSNQFNLFVFDRVQYQNRSTSFIKNDEPDRDEALLAYSNMVRG
jgi:hypothetical protein